ncbi:MAG: restriction endonuclease subunit S [Nitrosospira sp.]|nr:restriction endonuclease subunit S [Nitrosospira sp.]
MDAKDRTSNWITTAVGEVAALIRGITYGKEQSSKTPQPNFKPVLRANNINGTLNFEDLVFVPQNLIDSQQIIKAGDIIFAMSSGSKHLVGKSARARFDYDGSYGAFCGLLRPCKSVNKEFLYYVFQNNKFRRLISEVARGSSINNLKREHIVDFEILLPPLPEQQRIVAKIEELFSELDNGIENLKTAQAQLKVYRQALLKHAFEGKLTAKWREENKDKLETAAALLKRIQVERERRYRQQLVEWEAAGKQGSKPKAPKILPPLTAEELAGLPKLPEGWGWVKVDAYCDANRNSIKAGPFGSSLKKEFYVKEGYKVYGQEQVISGDWSYGDYFINEAKYLDLESCKVKPLDILISLVGTIGKVLVLPDNIVPGVINPRLVKISPNFKFLVPKFFKYYFESSFLKGLYKLKTHGATMDVLNLGIIEDLPFPICSLEEQQVLVQEIESRLSEVDQLDQTIITSLQQAEILRQSILKKAFSGQLVPQDPRDDPASALLARIKAEKSAQSHSRKARI